MPVAKWKLKTVHAVVSATQKWHWGLCTQFTARREDLMKLLNVSRRM